MKHCLTSVGILFFCFFSYCYAEHYFNILLMQIQNKVALAGLHDKGTYICTCRNIINNLKYHAHNVMYMHCHMKNTTDT